MIGDTDNMMGYLEQFDSESEEYGLPEASGLVIGSGSLAYHVKEMIGEEPFPVTDLDLYMTDEEFVEEMAETPYGTSFEDRRFGGGAYRLGEDREPLPESISSWDVHQGALSEGPVIDVMTRMDNTDVEWQLRAELGNELGDDLGMDHLDLRVITLTTFMDTKEGSNRTKDRYHKRLADSLLENSYPSYVKDEWKDEFVIPTDFDQVRRDQFMDEF
jgi:hypothetical protein